MTDEDVTARLAVLETFAMATLWLFCRRAIEDGEAEKARSMVVQVFELTKDRLS
jgi:hypothetical protein